MTGLWCKGPEAAILAVSPSPKMAPADRFCEGAWGLRHSGARASANPESRPCCGKNSGFRVRCGACHRAGRTPDPLAPPRNDDLSASSLSARRHGDAAAGSLGDREAGVRRLHLGEPRRDLRGERRRLLRFHVDMERQVLRCGGDPAFLGMKQLLEIVQALGVEIE